MLEYLPPSYGRLLVVYAVVGVLLWTVPLLSILHVESTAVIAAVSFFGAGLTSLTMFRSGMGLRRILMLQEAALLVPLLLLTVSAVWQPNCGYATGLLFFGIFPGVTVLFAVSLGRLFHSASLSNRPWILIAVGVILIVLPPLYDIGLHPQFYTYNHVFGGFLGPIYDERLALRFGLFAFRGLTVLWSILLVLVAAYNERRIPLFPAALVAALILPAYIFAPRLGFVTTHERIQAELSGVRHTSNFDIYYDPDVLDSMDVEVIADDHEKRYADLSQLLRTTVNGRILSYLYPDPDVKARLTGARSTNVAPIWLAQPQIHLLQSAYDRVFAHELVHVFSREFGLPLLRGSIAVGLVEGLAVALEPPNGAPGPHEQVSAAILSPDVEPDKARSRASDVLRVRDEVPGRITSHLSPLGFWTGRGPVSYTTMGSFVKFLLNAYGPEAFKDVYAWADFETVYGKAVGDLASEWTDAVIELQAVDRSAKNLVTARFATPSLFEKECPHFVPQFREDYLSAEVSLARRDSVDALDHLENSLQRRADYVPALDLWARLALAGGDEDRVVDRITQLHPDSMTSALHVRLGDALALTGRRTDALRQYEHARRGLPAYAHEAMSRVVLRSALVGGRESLRTLLGGMAVDSANTASGRMALALRLASRDRHEQAVHLLRTSLPHSLKAAVPVLGDVLVRRRLVWLANSAYRATMYEEAAVYADSAAAAYARVGAFNEAEVMQEFRTKIAWAATTSTEQVAGRIGRHYEHTQ